MTSYYLRGQIALVTGAGIAAALEAGAGLPVDGGMGM